MVTAVFVFSVSTGENEGAVVVSGRGSCSVLPLFSASFAPLSNFWTFFTCTLGWKNAYKDRYTHTYTTSVSIVANLHVQ